MTVVDVGKPPVCFQGWDSRLVRFHGFSSLPAAKQDCTVSPEFTCAGHSWMLQLYPGGAKSSDDGTIALYLKLKGHENVNTEFSFHIKDTDHDAVSCRTARSREFVPGKGIGYTNFAERDFILEALATGSLTIEVRIKLNDPTNLPFLPTNPTNDIILGMYLDEESSDIVFEVEREQQKRRQTRASFESSIVKFPAHRLIVGKCAPKLDLTQLSISNVKPHIFRLVLHFMYGGQVPVIDLKTNSKEIVEAAERFGMTHLKQQAEAWHVKTMVITVDTIKEHLIFANANRCALLKEAIVDYMVQNGCEIPESLTQKERKGLDDDILATMRGRKQSVGGDQFSTMRVSELRKTLEEAGLGIDGSRKEMIKTLRENAKTVDAIEGKLKSMKL